MNAQKNVIKHEEDKPERVQQRKTFSPVVDIFENEEELLIRADMPGVRTDDVNVHFEKNQITLEGTCTCLPEREGDPGFLYSRTFVVPGGINADTISAEMKNGLLSVRLPKHESLKPRQIKVTSV